MCLESGSIIESIAYYQENCNPSTSMKKGKMFAWVFPPGNLASEK
jgi:hypothetical protein